MSHSLLAYENIAHGLFYQYKADLWFDNSVYISRLFLVKIFPLETVWELVKVSTEILQVALTWHK